MSSINTWNDFQKVTKECETLHEVRISDDFKRWLRIVLIQIWKSDREVENIFSMIYYKGSILNSEDRESLRKVFANPLFQARAKELLRRLWVKLPESSSDFMKELLSDTGFWFIKDTTLWEINTILSRQETHIWSSETKLFIDGNKAFLWIWEINNLLSFSWERKYLAVWNLWIAILWENWVEIFKSGDLGIWEIKIDLENFYNHEKSSRELEITGENWVAILRYNWLNYEILTTGNLGIWKIEYFSLYRSEIEWETWIVSIDSNLETYDFRKKRKK